MRAGEEAKDKEQEELREERGAKARAARGLERKGARTASAKRKGKNRPFPFHWIYRPQACSLERTPRVH
jgi:hypothetical protein